MLIAKLIDIAFYTVRCDGCRRGESAFTNDFRNQNHILCWYHRTYIGYSVSVGYWFTLKCIAIQCVSSAKTPLKVHDHKSVIFKEVDVYTK